MSHMLHISPWTRLPLNVCWFIEKYKRSLQPFPPPHVKVHLDFINCSKDQAEASSQEDDLFAEQEGSISSQEDDQKDVDSYDDACSDDSFQALVNNYRKRPETPKKSSPVKKQMIIQRQINVSCILCDKEIDKSVSLSCKDEACLSQFHALCISKRCLSDENAPSTFQNIIPVKFVCPSCGISSSWGEYIRSVRCFNTVIVEDPKESPFLGATCVKRIVSQSQR
ncbi:unnamed protein product [Oikopleura dioica]|nr:unnamed protein product [Oikopleura dioica]